MPAVKGCYTYARHLRPLSREGSLSCHTRCNSEPRVLQSPPKDRFASAPSVSSNSQRGPVLIRIGSVLMTTIDKLLHRVFYGTIFPILRHHHKLSHLCFFFMVSVMQENYDTICTFLNQPEDTIPRFGLDF